MKILSELVPTSHSQEVGKSISSLPISAPSSSDTYATLNSVVTDAYDKQDLSNIFELMQKWPEPSAFPDPSTENLNYSDPFPESHSSPVYSGSYASSSPERPRNEFQFILGSPAASSHKSSELPMVYLNKGQFYPITLQGVDSSACLTATKVKTVVMAVFENDKTPEMQLRFWNHWHARQPTVKQRVIDIGMFFTQQNKYAWSIYIGINSLSTDFSSQKGVKGLPLNLQIDTYDISSGRHHLIYRAACQVKIFCDKVIHSHSFTVFNKQCKTGSCGSVPLLSSISSECTFFKSLDDLVTQPVFFIPETHLTSLQRMVSPSLTTSHVGMHNPAGDGTGTSEAGKNCGKVCRGGNCLETGGGGC
ncbi:hypothetical protein GOODEAATRI_013158 [Goodea atripinnis]|uniref:Grh/CP2 DB domain-containing protein n=1 Tax=Goodea atripinnis TaxID=208336 RepID=A0ABV0PXL4_9TELE